MNKLKVKGTSYGVAVAAAVGFGSLFLSHGDYATPAQTRACASTLGDTAMHVSKIAAACDRFAVPADGAERGSQIIANTDGTYEEPAAANFQHFYLSGRAAEEGTRKIACFVLGLCGGAITFVCTTTPKPVAEQDVYLAA